MDRRRSRRSGFTLIEILVVIGILVLLTVLAVAAFRTNESEKIRSGARTAQSAILGARDRALHAKALRGFRITRDPQDNNIGTGFAYVQKLDYVPYGPNAISLERMDVDGNSVADSPEVVIVRGIPGTDWYALASFFPASPRIKILDASGNGVWYTFEVLTAGPYALSQANPVLHLLTPFIDAGTPAPAVVAHTTASGFSSAELDVGTELLPNHAPIALPSGVVIDLNYSSPVARGDMMFSPRGMIGGPASSGGPIYILLRDIRDVTEGINPANTTSGVMHRDMLVVTIFPATGHCAAYPVDPTDSDANGTADDLFRFAKIGSAAGG